MPGVPKLATIAKELGVTKGRISQMKAAGMPVNSVAAARAWKEANVRVRVDFDKGATDPTPLAYDIAEARARREHHEANIAAMKEAQLAGSLVEAKRVDQAAMLLGRLTRDALLGLPVRLAPELAQQDIPTVERLLTQALRATLADVAKIQAAELEAPE
jgi:phage terminase Nu1 subunit (DNA packaging protein)